MPKRTHDGIKKRCTCGKRQWPKCSHPWWFSFHWRDVEHRYSLDKLTKARGIDAPVTKGEAMTLRDQLRNEIRAGTFQLEPAAAVTADKRLTLGDVCDDYLKRFVAKPNRRPKGRAEMETLIAVFRRAEIPGPKGTSLKLEQKPIADVTKADVEAVRDWRRAQQAEKTYLRGAKQGEVGINRMLARLRHLFSWAIEEGHLENTPFRRGPVTVVRLEKSAEAPRSRRLEAAIMQTDGSIREGEEARLLREANPHLRALITAALSTGCRLGELLSMQWSQIRRDESGQAKAIILHASKTKTGELRVLPVSANLRAALDLRKHGPDGKEHPPAAYVFGNDVGEPVKSIRTAWELTCERAGITGLHFHDLRREFACRLLESSADLHDVREFLGHANITTTSRYLQSTATRLEQVIARFDAAAAAKPSAVPGDGFAHHSHKPPSEAPDGGADAGGENHRKRLN